MSAGPTTAREALFHEAFGDLLGLVEQVEALKQDLPVVAQATVGQIDEAGRIAAGQVSASGRQAAQQVGTVAKAMIEALDRERVAWGAAADKQVSESRAAANLVAGAARKMAWMALAIGLGGGVIGGVLAGLALARFTLN